jgi:hypothetical protein
MEPTRPWTGVAEGDGVDQEEPDTICKRGELERFAQIPLQLVKGINTSAGA